MSKRLTRISIKGVSDEDYEAYKHILELNMRTIFSSIVEKSISDPDFKNGEGRYVWPLIIKDLHYAGALEQGTIYRMEKGKIILILTFELGSMYMSIYRSDEEYRNRIEKLKEIAADIFENLVEGVKKNGIDIDGEVHMDFDSFTPRIQKKVSANV